MSGCAGHPGPRNPEPTMSGNSYKKSAVYRIAERHSARLREIAHNASMKSWAHDDAMRAVYHARTREQYAEAIERLTNVNEEYAND